MWGYVICCLLGILNAIPYLNRTHRLHLTLSCCFIFGVGAQLSFDTGVVDGQLSYLVSNKVIYWAMALLVFRFEFLPTMLCVWLEMVVHFTVLFMFPANLLHTLLAAAISIGLLSVMSFSRLRCADADCGGACVSPLCNLRHEILQRSEFMVQARCAVEMLRVDNLLHDMMPPSVAEELKRKEKTALEIASHFDDVSVLFADICNFNELVHQLGARGARSCFPTCHC
jgi:hypothetical protein